MKADLFTYVGAFSRGLDSLAHVLAKGAEHAAGQGVSTAQMLDWRLIEDMHPLRAQVRTVCNFATQWPARAAGLPLPADVDGDQDLPGLLADIAKAKAYLAGLTAAQFEGADAREATVNIGQEMTLPLGQWIPGFAMPNFYFHLSMAYAILRARGVAVGKRDFFAGGL
jgi:uncharacterized protein